MSRFTNLFSLYTDQKNVTVSGTPVQLNNQSIPSGIPFIIKAKDSNVGVITIGGTSANALNSSNVHYKLKKNETIQLYLENTNLVWIDSTSSGDGVEVIAEL